MTVFGVQRADMIRRRRPDVSSDDNHPGVDLILPDTLYVLENADKLRGIVITHGHDGSHGNSSPSGEAGLDRNVPIYGTKMTPASSRQVRRA